MYERTATGMAGGHEYIPEAGEARVGACTYTPEVGARSVRGRCVEIVACVRVRPAADFVRVCRVSDYVGASGVRYGRKCYDC